MTKFVPRNPYVEQTFGRKTGPFKDKRRERRLAAELFNESDPSWKEIEAEVDFEHERKKIEE